MAESAVTSGGANTLAIVIPVFNDWDSLTILVQKLDTLAPSLGLPVSLFIVDDGSHLPPALSSLTPQNLGAVELISLHCNLGHQRAIATGVSDILRRDAFSFLLVMDSDGEDAPEDIPRLLKAAIASPTSIVVARRARRSEGSLFRWFYLFYKIIFRSLTGHHIDFGNFCLLPAFAARKLSYMPDSWNHFAATIVKSRIPIVRVPTARGQRYSGKSSMNMISLVGHGFSAISVFSDAVLTRLVLVIGLFACTSVGIGVMAVILKFCTDLAIPGWATSVMEFSILLFLQALTILVVLVFTNLTHRSSIPFVPGFQSKTFISRISILWPRSSHANY